ncbi:MAG: hypothetical protein LBQ79_10905 [Deltaproteobacteria bacterium]|jgi:dsDNA-specific endonuclease/ATPase MutS2|nr:hypothetical protein [Deltaproteobacteria bacterium]
MDRSLSPEGDVLYNVSAEQWMIRRETAAARRTVPDKLAALIRSEEYRHTVRDEIVTDRRERFVLPISASGTGKARGWFTTGPRAAIPPAWSL